MKLEEFLELLSQFRGDFTVQTITRLDFNFENEYIRIIGIGSSNVTGGEAVYRGKQWGIIFEYTPNDFRQLETLQGLIAEYNDIQITPRRGYPGQNAIRFYRMSLCPNTEIINAFIRFIFG